MKKLISLTLALMLVMSLAVPALALSNDQTTDVRDVVVAYTGTETYTVTIPSAPASQNVAATLTIGDVSIDAMKLETGHTLTVTQSIKGKTTSAANVLDHATNGYTITAAMNDLSLAIAMDDWAKTGDDALADTAKKATSTVSLSGYETIPYGTYTGVITYTCTVS